MITKKGLLPKRLRPYKNEIYYDLWEKYKGPPYTLLMTDLCNILRCTVSQFYKIVKRETERRK